MQVQVSVRVVKKRWHPIYDMKRALEVSPTCQLAELMGAGVSPRSRNVVRPGPVLETMKSGAVQICDFACAPAMMSDETNMLNSFQETTLLICLHLAQSGRRPPAILTPLQHARQELKTKNWGNSVCYWWGELDEVSTGDSELRGLPQKEKKGKHSVTWGPDPTARKYEQTKQPLLYSQEFYTKLEAVLTEIRGSDREMYSSMGYVEDSNELEECAWFARRDKPEEDSEQSREGKYSVAAPNHTALKYEQAKQLLHSQEFFLFHILPAFDRMASEFQVALEQDLAFYEAAWGEHQAGMASLLAKERLAVSHSKVPRQGGDKPCSSHQAAEALARSRAGARSWSSARGMYGPGVYMVDSNGLECAWFARRDKPEEDSKQSREVCDWIWKLRCRPTEKHCSSPGVRRGLAACSGGSAQKTLAGGRPNHRIEEGEKDTRVDVHLGYVWFQSTADMNREMHALNGNIEWAQLRSEVVHHVRQFFPDQEKDIMRAYDDFIKEYRDGGASNTPFTLIGDLDQGDVDPHPTIAGLVRHVMQVDDERQDELSPTLRSWGLSSAWSQGVFVTSLMFTMTWVAREVMCWWVSRKHRKHIEKLDLLEKQLPPPLPRDIQLQITKLRQQVNDWSFFTSGWDKPTVLSRFRLARFKAPVILFLPVGVLALARSWPRKSLLPE